MDKYLNTTGLCVPELHYMVDITNKIEKIDKIINICIVKRTMLFSSKIY